MRPLEGVRVVDFSTLLPGPMAGLILAEAGAEVIKVERPKVGEDARYNIPRFGDDASVNFALLNRGKRSVAVDLKDPDSVEAMKRLIASADIVLEQFRPGVMDRLGLGYEALRAVNSSLIYCAITGYGQSGPKANFAAHDLNYVADTGLLGLAADRTGAPVVPHALVADIGGGTMPAVISILLALRVAEKTGEGAFLDVSMTDNLFAWEYWATGIVDVGEEAPAPASGRVSGGSARYQVYQAKCGRWLAVAPLEDRFWSIFTRLIELEPEFIDDAPHPMATRDRVAEILGGRTADEWMAIFDGHDVCVNVVRTIAEAKADPHFAARGIFAGEISDGKNTLVPIPPPFAPALRDTSITASYPGLGQDNDLLEGKG